VSWLTTCPDCRTVFRIGNGQLSIREGMVRCGVCGAVFDARDSLARLEEEESWPELPAETPSGLDEMAGPPPESEDAQPEVEETTGTPEAQPETFVGPQSAPQQVDAWGDWDKPAEAEQPVEAVTETESRNAIAADEEEAVAETPPTDRSRSSRAFWWSAFLILLLLVPLQLLVVYRAYVMVMWPATRPAFEAVCSTFGCETGLPRDAEYLKIVSSDLQADPKQADHIGFHVQLINQGSFPLAWPLLELTLTDAGDRPIARRVFQPEEYLTRDAAEGIDSGQEISVDLGLTVSDLPAAGYRVYVFYATR
jgi:predicted Zn finger-like uncharacterized protein